jgi:tripartite-type tricarboxylate transporter receptor subunit TctC
MFERIGLAAGVIAGLAAAALPAGAQSVEEFYKGKQIEVIIGTTPGGSYDVWARLLGRHMGKHLPGNPTFVARNMPGAGTMTAANHIFNNAPRDGTVLGFVSRNMPTQDVLGHQSVKFKTAEFNWIGSPELTNRVCAATGKAKVKKAEDLLKDELVVGGVAATAISTTPTLMNKLLGMKFKVVDGYPGGTEVFLAMEKGEVDGICQTLAAVEGAHAGWVKEGKVNILFNLEEKRLANYNVPSIHEFAKTDEQKKILAFYNSNAELGRPVMTTPGVPKDRVQALRRAFDATMKDPDFLAEATKLKLQVDPLTGEQVAAVAEMIAATPKAIIDKTIDLVGTLGE